MVAASPCHFASAESVINSTPSFFKTLRNGKSAALHINNANVWSVEDVMSRACRPGKRVLLLDDGGNWRGCGTAWYLAAIRWR